jgi:starch synthase
MTSPPAVLQVSAELFPFVKTGGLADVAAALPPALIDAGADVRLLLPGLPAYLQSMGALHPVAKIDMPWRDTVSLLRGQLQGVKTYVIDAPALYNRPGNPYADASGAAYPDNHRRFGLLGLVAAKLGSGLDAAWQPQIVHGHDWHAGLASAALRFARWPGKAVARSVFTVHNLAYQGLFPDSASVDLGLPSSAMQMRGLEFFGQLSFMKAGLQYADALTTVSPSYAAEITTPEQGCGLDGVLRERSGVLHGVLNGCDYSVWHPSADAHLPAPFDADHLQGKSICKAALQAEVGLQTRPDAVLFGMVSRLVEQKGVQLVIDHLPAFLQTHHAQLVVVGEGDATMERALHMLAEQHPGRIAFVRAVSEPLAHRVIAGSDVLLVPSRFEPCGLTQMYAMAYGTLPLVHRVGGLADTVADAALENIAANTATGIVFERYEAGDFNRALHRTLALKAEPDAWRQVQRRAMAQRFEWRDAANRYMSIYRSVLTDAPA